jgi:hypothetical protein
LCGHVHWFSLHFFDYVDAEEFCQAVGDGLFGEAAKQ